MSEQEKQLPLNEDRDAARWAREFNEVLVAKGEQPIDPGLLISWFANAMMCGEDTYRWRQEKSARSATDALEVTCGSMHESNGNVTWAVFLRRPGDGLMDSHQVYADEIEGRAKYEAAKLRHFLGQGPEPDILDFDTSPRTETESQRAEAEPTADARDAARYRHLREYDDFAYWLLDELQKCGYNDLALWQEHLDEGVDAHMGSLSGPSKP